jgi:arsenate reductase-like glutaredoxin family protein
VRTLDPGVVERNYAKTPLTRAEVDAILAAVGSTAAVLNARHATAKAKGWTVAAPPSKAELAAAAVEENNLLRRPITVRGKRAVVGNDEAALRALLG